MKKIKIFLGSSISEEKLNIDRVYVGDFIRQLNDTYIDNGIYFSLVKCEDYDNAIAAGGKQSEFDREIRESELIFFLFFKKVGDYTRHEFEVALDSFNTSNKPKIITYFKYVNTPDEAGEEIKTFMTLLDGELKHNYNTYNHIDALKLGILMQIKLMKLDASEIKLRDGAVLLNGQRIVTAENVPILRGNETLMELTRKKKELTEALNACRAAYLADPTSENENAFVNTSAELNAVSKQLTEIEKSVIEFLSSIAEKTSEGKILTYRYKQALKYYNQGDFATAQKIFYEEESFAERERTRTIGNMLREEAEGYVNENSLLIESLKMQGLTTERVDEIISKYEDSMQWIEDYNLNDKSAMYDYASFLCDQKKYNKSICVAKKILWYYENLNNTEIEELFAMILSLLGKLYFINKKYNDAKSAYSKSLKLYTQLNDSNTPRYTIETVYIYEYLAILYKLENNSNCAMEMYKKTIETQQYIIDQDMRIYGRVQYIEHRYEHLAHAYCELGEIYQDCNQQSDANEAYHNALEIYNHLETINKGTYQKMIIKISSLLSKL